MKNNLKTVYLFIFIVFILVFDIIFFEAQISTDVSIIVHNNSILIQNIPDQIIPMNTNKSNVFDLDDHFYDDLPITFNVSSSPNITIIINETTNIVSFYPDYGFEGVRTVVFTALNGLATKDSNLVTINVTNDTIAPSWSNLVKDKTNIEQNTVVTFNATWIDNMMLRGHFISINQGGGFINHSISYFDGLENVSSYPVQISATGGTVVYWRIMGFDSSGNLNMTSIQNFTVNSSTTTTTSTSTSGSEEDDDSTPSPTISKQIIKKNPEYTVVPSDGFKLELKQTESGQVSFKISNTGARQISFIIRISELGKIEYDINENNFTLDIGESKIITINLDTDKYTPVDIYYGKIELYSTYDDMEIPLIVIVNPYENIFDLNISIPPEFKEVKPLEEVKANITLSNLKDIEDRNFTMYYAITDFYGNVIDSKYEEINFNSRFVILEREFIIPENTPKGNYLFISRGLSGKDIIFDADSFNVGEKFDAWGFFRSNLIFILILFASLIVALLMVRYRRAKEKSRLLNLYLLITELDKLVKEGKFDQAVEIFVRIKGAYHEPVSNTLLKNKEELKKEMQKLAQDLDINVIKKIEERNENEKKDQEKKENDKKAKVEAKNNKDSEKKEGENPNKSEKVDDDKKESEVKKPDLANVSTEKIVQAVKENLEVKKEAIKISKGDVKSDIPFLEKISKIESKDKKEEVKTDKKEEVKTDKIIDKNEVEKKIDNKTSDKVESKSKLIKKKIIHKLSPNKSKLKKKK